LRKSDGSWEGQALKGDTYSMITLDPAGHVTQRQALTVRPWA